SILRPCDRVDQGRYLVRGPCTTRYACRIPIVQEDFDEPHRTCVLARLTWSRGDPRVHPPRARRGRGTRPLALLRGEPRHRDARVPGRRAREPAHGDARTVPGGRL